MTTALLILLVASLSFLAGMYIENKKNILK